LNFAIKCRLFEVVFHYSESISLIFCKQEGGTMLVLQLLLTNEYNWLQNRIYGRKEATGSYNSVLLSLNSEVILV